MAQWCDGAISKEFVSDALGQDCRYHYLFSTDRARASRILNLKFSCEIKHHSKIARTLVARHIKNV